LKELQSLLKQARKANTNNEFSKALEYCNHAIQISSFSTTTNKQFQETRSTLFCARGFAFDELKQFEKAIDSYNSAIEINPKYAAAYNNRGISLYHLGKYEEAIDSYNSAIMSNPNDEMIH